MMIRKKIIACIILICFFSSVYGQQATRIKINDIFFNYITQKLSLNSQDAVRMRPLVNNYLKEVREAHRNSSDILLRDQQKIALKIKYRDIFTDIIGIEKANRFFILEQNFRKKVRDELQERKNKRNGNNV